MSGFDLTTGTGGLPFATVIEAGQRAGELSTNLKPAQAARFLVNGLQGALFRCKVDRTSAALVDLEEIIFGPLLPPAKLGLAERDLLDDVARLGGLSLHGALQRTNPFRVSHRLGEEARSDHRRAQDLGFLIGRRAVRRAGLRQVIE